MSGPPPKNPKIRQRRNRVTGATLTATDKPRQRAPRLPKRDDDQEWHRLTRAWWRDVWHSPMAEQFLEVDKHALYRLAMLIDAFWSQPSRQLAAEIRLEQQAFGLTPLDRRRLQWSVGQEEERRRTRTRQSPHERGDDPRKILRMVASK